MRRSLLPAVLLTFAVGACGGGNAATPATSSGGGGATGSPTEAPARTGDATATQANAEGGGSKPAGWDRFGTVHVEIGGPATKSADYGFVPAGSIFGGAQGSSLNFTIEGSDEVVAILVGADGKAVISYGGKDFALPGTQCTTSDWNIGATSGSGKFDCTAAFTIMGSGAAVPGGTLKGSFDAHN